MKHELISFVGLQAFIRGMIRMPLIGCQASQLSAEVII